MRVKRNINNPLVNNLQDSESVFRASGVKRENNGRENEK